MIDTQRLHDDTYRWEIVATLMQDHGDAITRYCLTWLGEGLAEDITQEVFVAAWQQLAKYRLQATLRTWLFGIARHKCQQMYRNRARRQTIARMFGEEIRTYTHTENPPQPGEDAGEHLAIAAQLQASLAKLRNEERMLLVLYYWKNQPLQEIADIMGKSLAAVRKRLTRAQQRLRELMHETLEA